MALTSCEYGETTKTVWFTGANETVTVNAGDFKTVNVSSSEDLTGYRLTGVLCASADYDKLQPKVVMKGFECTNSTKNVVVTNYSTAAVQLNTSKVRICALYVK